MWTERILKGVIGVAGFIAIVGSGSGAGLGSLFDCFDYCGQPITLPAMGSVSISPPQTVQMGTPATIKASASTLSHTDLKYEWCRAAAGARCVTMPGEVGPTLTIASPGPLDDGAIFTVKVTALADNSNQSKSTQLFVSSMPALILQDGEFLDSDWTATSIVTPAGVASTYSIARLTEFGHPGAYRKVSYDVLQSGDVRVLHEKVSATYDPRIQGAIRSIDFAMDCLLVTRSYEPWTKFLIEQAGRRYVVTQLASFRELGTVGACGGAIRPFDPTWLSLASPSYVREDFEILDGPGCGAGESCPDFSATAAPIQFGMMTEAAIPGPVNPGAPTTPFHFEHGIDNWKVTIWRK